MRYETRLRKRESVNEADKSGEVADSVDVRMKLMDRVKSGEITLSEAQQELKKIKRNAKKNGLRTRQQVWSQS